jgi:hypothetical protein
VTAQAGSRANVVRLNPQVRVIHFSGYDWWVKSSPARVGPGPNYFSDSTNHVWVDAQGRLHLRISQVSTNWSCAEVVATRTFGYGSYRFELASSVNDLDPNAVLGLFTWSDDPDDAHREIDIEGSRWGNAADVNNAQYVVQPWDMASHLLRYAVPAGQTNSTHLFTWETNRVVFQSMRGSYSPNPSPTQLIRQWTYTRAVPQTGDENVRINLWLYSGRPPTDRQEVECVISSFQFVPLGPAQPAVLTHPNRVQDGSFRFELNGQFDRRYQVEVSNDLLDWHILTTLLATNRLMDFLDPYSAGSERWFYRAVTVP